MKQNDTILLGAFIGVFCIGAAACGYALFRRNTEEPNEKYIEGELYHISSRNNSINICLWLNNQFHVLNTYDSKENTFTINASGHDTPVYNIKYGDIVKLLGHSDTVTPNEFYYVNVMGTLYLCKAQAFGEELKMCTLYRIQDNKLRDVSMRYLTSKEYDKARHVGIIKSITGGKRNTRNTRRRRNRKVSKE